MSWATRTSLTELLEADGLPAGVALVGVPGEGLVPVGVDELEQLAALSQATLADAGIRSGDRVLLSLNNDGDMAGAGLARAIAMLGATATCIDPRGRMRLLGVMRALRPGVWVTTPQGALDFLARLYLEFNVDPIDLDLERILLVGEIASPGAHRRLADEFESEVADLYCDPFFGAALARGEDGRVTATDPGALALAELADDEIRTQAFGDPGEGLAEIALRPHWSSLLSGTVLRTGQVQGGEGGGLFQHSIGEHLLARGRWLSLPALRRVLALIDGTVAWRLEVERGDGTLDRVRFVLGFDRPTLVDNPMWAERARQAVASTTPVSFELEVEQAVDAGAAGQIGCVVDQRGHHLGLDRVAVAARLAGEHPSARAEMGTVS